MSFLALGINLPLGLRRAIVAGVFGMLGFLLALVRPATTPAKYESFLLVIAYWIGPWLAGSTSPTGSCAAASESTASSTTRPTTRGRAGRHGRPAWSSRSGCSPTRSSTSAWSRAVPAFGDITFEVGFVVSAVLYALLFRLQRGRTDEDLGVPDSPAVLTEPA